MITPNSFLPKIDALNLPVQDLSPKSDYLQVVQIGEQMKNAPIQRQEMYARMDNMRQQQEMNRQIMQQRSQEFEYEKQLNEEAKLAQLETMRDTMWASTSKLWGQNFLNDADKATWEKEMEGIDIENIHNLDSQGIAQLKGEINKRMASPKIRDILKRNAQVEQLTDFALKNADKVNKGEIIDVTTRLAGGENVNVNMGSLLAQQDPMQELFDKYSRPEFKNLANTQWGYDSGLELFQSELERKTGKPIDSPEAFEQLRGVYDAAIGFKPEFKQGMRALAEEVAVNRGESADDWYDRFEGYAQMFGEGTPAHLEIMNKARTESITSKTTREANEATLEKERIKNKGQKMPSFNTFKSFLGISSEKIDGVTSIKIGKQNIEDVDLPVEIEASLRKAYTPTVWDAFTPEQKEHLVNLHTLQLAVPTNTGADAHVFVSPAFIENIPEIGQEYRIPLGGKEVTIPANARVIEVDKEQVLIIDEATAFSTTTFGGLDRNFEKAINLGGGYYAVKLPQSQQKASTQAPPQTKEQEVRRSGVTLDGYRHIAPQELEAASSVFGGDELLGNYLMASIGGESAWNKNAKNPSSSGQGLLQILSGTLAEMNKWRTKQGMDEVTYEDIEGMSAEQVIQEVYPFFNKDLKGQMDAARVRLSLLYPAAAKNGEKYNSAKPTAVVFSKTSDKAAYEGNKGLDRHGDGTVTIADVLTSTAKNIPGMTDVFDDVTELFGKNSIKKGVTSVVDEGFARELKGALSEFSKVANNKNIVFTEMWRDPANLPSYGSKNTNHAWGGALDIGDNEGGKEFVEWIKGQQKQGKYMNIKPEYHTKGTAPHYHINYAPTAKNIKDEEGKFSKEGIRKASAYLDDVLGTPKKIKEQAAPSGAGKYDKWTN